MNMNYQVVFWALVILGLALLFTIWGLSQAIKKLVGSAFLKERLKELADKSKGAAPLFLMLLGVAYVLPAAAQAAEGLIPDIPLQGLGQTEVIVVAIIDLMLLGVVFFLRRLFYDVVKMTKTVEEVAEMEVKEAQALNKFITDAVPIEREEEILMDHEYDGIRELDNNLPPWWQGLFYGSIVFGVIYLFYFHVFGAGDLQIAAYEKEVERANIEIAEYLKESALNVDENTVTLLTESTDMVAGQEIFKTYCAVCHGQNGEGQVGPNMTDDYWIYGPKIKDLFKTIKYGAKNGMKSWKDELNPLEMQQVASYMKSLHGTDPANQKEPQGDYYDPAEEMSEVAGDSLSVMEPDSVAVDSAAVIVEEQ